ncbi:MAG TPA: DNA-directed RNA polymerase subunit omega [Bacteroidota bacterium]|nr:DNA-directed RNA polymerase subunit omega [Bacteroidota bacterium]
MPIKPVDMQGFIGNVGNIYQAIVVTAKRARQLHEEMKIELNQRLETVKALTTTTEVEEELDNAAANPDQLKISLEFEKRPKATDLALDEVQEGKVEFRYKEPAEIPVKKDEEEETE